MNRGWLAAGAVSVVVASLIPWLGMTAESTASAEKVVKRGLSMMKVVTLADFHEFTGDKMKKNNLFQTERFFCDIYCFEPGQEQKGHVHGDQDKVYIVLAGQGTFQVGADHRILEAGQGTMASAGEEHGVKNHTGRRLIVLVFVTPNPA